MASLFPQIQWSAIEHPDPPYASRQTYLSMFRSYNCHLAIVDLLREPLPFPDNHFALVTFSEVLEHLSIHRVNFVLSEIARIIQPGGVLIASSPNQASLENRLRLVKGKSILDMPNEVAKGIFGHIRLYTPSEMQPAWQNGDLLWSVVRWSPIIPVIGGIPTGPGFGAFIACTNI